MGLEELIDFLKDFNVQQFCEESLQQTEDGYLQMQRRQMNDGLLASGNNITPPYSARTARKKGRSTPDLYETGEFYSGMNVTVGGGNLNITSSVDYTKWIESRYTPGIWGLDDEYQTQFAEQFLIPLVNEKLQEMMGLD